MNRFAFSVDIQKVPLTNLIFCVTWAYYKIYNKIPTFEEVASELREITSIYLNSNVEGIDREYNLLKQDSKTKYRDVDNPNSERPYYLSDEYFAKMLALHKDHTSFINHLYVRELTNIFLKKFENYTREYIEDGELRLKLEPTVVYQITEEGDKEIFNSSRSYCNDWIWTILKDAANAERMI